RACRSRFYVCLRCWANRIVGSSAIAVEFGKAGHAGADGSICEEDRDRQSRACALWASGGGRHATREGIRPGEEQNRPRREYFEGRAVRSVRRGRHWCGRPVVGVVGADAEGGTILGDSGGELSAARTGSCFIEARRSRGETVSGLAQTRRE